MENLLTAAFTTFNLKIGSFNIRPNYITAFMLVFLTFLLIFSLARMHRLFIHWSFKGGVIGVLIGILLTLTIEGFFIMSGSTVLTAFLGWKNAPKPVAKLLDESKLKLHDSVCIDDSKQNNQD
ncbi:MAG: hypothetical protein AAB546_04465 [Patescibacteria group bacterium]